MMMTLLIASLVMAGTLALRMQVQEARIAVRVDDDKRAGK
jgi:hypothetical protein